MSALDALLLPARRRRPRPPRLLLPARRDHLLERRLEERQDEREGGGRGQREDEAERVLAARRHVAAGGGLVVGGGPDAEQRGGEGEHDDGVGDGRREALRVDEARRDGVEAQLRGGHEREGGHRQVQQRVRVHEVVEAEQDPDADVDGGHLRRRRRRLPLLHRVRGSQEQSSGMARSGEPPDCMSVATHFLPPEL